MPKFKPLPPLERLNELLEVVEIPECNYGKWSGLRWKVDRRGAIKAGDVAGNLMASSKVADRFDWIVCVDYAKYCASRIIYCMAQGEYPGDVQVDHEDQNSLNNNPWNLRLDVEGTIQQVNQKKPRHNTSGVVGVGWYGPTKKWRGYVHQAGKYNHLGLFDCKIEAAYVVNKKWIELGWNTLGRELNNLENIECNCKSCASLSSGEGVS